MEKGALFLSLRFPSLISFLGGVRAVSARESHLSLSFAKFRILFAYKRSKQGNDILFDVNFLRASHDVKQALLLVLADVDRDFGLYEPKNEYKDRATCQDDNFWAHFNCLRSLSSVYDKHKTCFLSTRFMFFSSCFFAVSASFFQQKIADIWPMKALNSLGESCNNSAAFTFL